MDLDTVPPAGELLIRLEQAALKFRLRRPLNGSREFWPLQSVTLDLHRGERLGILGSNGAGKTTLMKLLAGIYEKDRGTVWRAPGLSVSLLSIGIGFESTLTGHENAILVGMLFGLHRATIEKRIPRIRDFAELGGFFDQPLYTYSSGMLLRLGFSVAMEVNPDVLLLDEVMGVGDAHFIEKSTQALSDKIHSGLTVAFITHDPEAVRKLCTRAVWIDKGATRLMGTPDEVLAAYLLETTGSIGAAT